MGNAIKMKAAIKNPYLDTMGGGERYTLSFALVLLKKGYTVDIEWEDKNILKDLEDRFGMKLRGINIVADIKKGDGYDLCFWVSDGSIPTLRSRKNILHFQVPFHDVNGKSLLNKMKLFRINKIICNSNFTKKVVDEEYGVNSIVIYPPVPITELKSKRKENIIIYVGRFSQLKQSKGQDILIKAFKKLCLKGVNGWKLILVGGADDNKYIKKLEEMVGVYPIEIIKNPDFKILKDMYGKARFFWSAAGYGEDEKRHPEKVEHFGITVVEAMASGAIPFVFNAGGHKEIVKDGINGYLWRTTSELLKSTKGWFKNKNLYRKISLNALESSKKYSYEIFQKEIINLLGN